jgi:hypothetical protein
MTQLDAFPPPLQLSPPVRHHGTAEIADCGDRRPEAWSMDWRMVTCKACKQAIKRRK